ncbi:Mariner Mos1 transposase [Eumeta japonica]|uniref:Mariner Mos1 transposase n=1 Tax=Eumeta variegata TaxID=151549 RepID=A0A4C2A3G7_EUMVA|nr:Mariner Mos1 transposase [Eumeta japonica]
MSIATVNSERARASARGGPLLKLQARNALFEQRPLAESKHSTKIFRLGSILSIITIDEIEPSSEGETPSILHYSRHDKIILLYADARPHVAVPEKNYLKTLDWEVIPHPPYSPDIVSSDCHLFRSMAHALSEQRFTSYEDTKN